MAKHSPFIRVAILSILCATTIPINNNLPTEVEYALLLRMINLETYVMQMVASQSEYELLEDSVGKTSLVDHITAMEILPKFTAPKFKEYNGALDPYQHICYFDQIIARKIILEKHIIIVYVAELAFKIFT